MILAGMLSKKAPKKNQHSYNSGSECKFDPVSKHNRLIDEGCCYALYTVSKEAQLIAGKDPGMLKPSIVTCVCAHSADPTKVAGT